MVSHLTKVEAKLGFILKKSLMGKDSERNLVCKHTAQVMRRAILVLVQIQYELRLYVKYTQLDTQRNYLTPTC